MPVEPAGFTPALAGLKVVPVDEQTVNLVATIGPSKPGGPNWAAILAALAQALPAILALISAFINQTPTPPTPPK